MTPPPKKQEPPWNEALDEPCPICDRRKGDHTMDEYVVCIRKRVEKLREAATFPAVIVDSPVNVPDNPA